MFYGIVARMYFVPEDGEGITCNAPDSLRSQVIAALAEERMDLMILIRLKQRPARHSLCWYLSDCMWLQRRGA